MEQRFNEYLKTKVEDNTFTSITLTGVNPNISTGEFIAIKDNLQKYYILTEKNVNGIYSYEYSQVLNKSIDGVFEDSRIYELEERIKNLEDTLNALLNIN